TLSLGCVRTPEPGVFPEARLVSAAMRILIDATSLLLRSAGIKTYTYYWIQHLWQQAGNEQILTFPRINKLAPLNHERSILSPSQTYPRLALLYAANLLPALPLLR